MLLRSTQFGRAKVESTIKLKWQVLCKVFYFFKFVINLSHINFSETSKLHVQSCQAKQTMIPLIKGPKDEVICHVIRIYTIKKYIFYNNYLSFIFYSVLL